ncbi:PREDICTED: uncharacterized protein LOC105956219 [Erythranthe guttata]|uniref:uncharacterized protein LOC105956219 n=1 Tax=Erythranthe guttata TaxID=4155 RepID=UPI00064D9411|nr:PREDICTED: uncharacterized protein LOC105956219 [Erythranthe guttata]|eukprot:XP_012835519.1 PREDICTED: uncharacterized protein LOC105956219 [Erythranthe guttata]
MDFNVDLNVLGDHRVHGDSPSDREKSLNNQGETRELKEDVVCNYRVTQQIGNAYDDSDIKNQLSLLIARVSNIERQAKYVQDDFFIRNQLSLFGARLSGFEQQMTQLMNTMGEVLIRCVTRSASGDQFGDQPSSQENVDKFKDVLKELKILELKIPSMIWDTWDVICRKANNAHISSNVTGQKIEVDTVLKKKIDEDTALKQKIEKDIALKKKIEEDTALKQKIEENTAFKQKIEEDTVLAKKLEKDTVLEKQIEEDIIYIHENEQLISAKEKESPINPIGADFDAIIKFLFDPNLDQSTWVINFGGRGCNRKNLMGLKPCEFIDGIVIDCVAFLCTRKSIEGRMEDARWYFPAIFAQLCLTGNFPDEHIINTIDYCTSRMDDCYQIYLPVNDLRGHWFLAIIDFDNKEVNICDSAASRESNNYRRDLLDQVIIRMEHLIQKWRPKEYAIKNIKDSFSYEYPDWVPRQPNGYIYIIIIIC